MSETAPPDTAEVSGTGGVAGLAPVEWQRPIHDAVIAVPQAFG
jgi:hypothetical protein